MAKEALEYREEDGRKLPEWWHKEVEALINNKKKYTQCGLQPKIQTIGEGMPDTTEKQRRESPKGKMECGRKKCEDVERNLEKSRVTEI